MGETVNCLKGKAHHYIVDDDNIGKCKHCGFEKTFEEVPIPPKETRRYWEISYELLRDYELSKDAENNYDDWYS